MTKLRLLVAEANVPEDRARLAEVAGATPSESYAAVLAALAPGARIDICFPADPDPRLPAEISSYDGVVITGSALTIHRREPPALRQIDFARAVFASGVPMFGSCWGLQLAAVAAGGDVARNPRGREVAFARRITLTEAGRAHPMHAGRAERFDAPAIHADEVVRLPEGAVLTAGNGMSVVQAAEIRHGRGTFWGVQYHPEYRLADIAAVVRRYAPTLVEERIFTSTAAIADYVAELERLEADPACLEAAARLKLGSDILLPDERMRELDNWLARQVRGARAGKPDVRR